MISKSINTYQCYLLFMVKGKLYKKVSFTVDTRVLKELRTLGFNNLSELVRNLLESKLKQTLDSKQVEGKEKE